MRDAKQVVRSGSVPFVSLKDYDFNINWKFVRFEPDAVVEWETQRRRKTGVLPKDFGERPKVLIKPMW